MNSCKKLLLLVLLATLTLAQTNFNNSCQTDSMLPLLATGVINLNPLDTYNAGANKDFYRDLSSAQFQTTDVLGYGFALSGFQASCNSQAYYTLIVDKVQFENQNTRMRIVINFLNPSSIGTSTTITKWNLVTFTYIVVSRNFGGTSSPIWATTAEGAITASIEHLPIDQIASAFQDDIPTTNCVAYQDPLLVFDPAACVPTDAWATAGDAGGQLIVHAYIMGFQWNSARSTTQYLAASGFLFLNDDTIDTSLAEVYVEGVDTGPAADVTGPTMFYGVDAAPAGPVVYVDSQGGALQYIKLAFVYSIMDAFYKPAQGGATRYPTVYNENPEAPFSSALSYSSSYVFTKVSTFNAAVPIIQGDTTKTTLADGITYNQWYMTLPDARYAIYGLSGFSIPKNKNSVCTSTLWVNATLNNINTYTVSTPNANPANFWFSADIFAKNVFEICTPADGTSPFSFLTNIGKKSFFTVPTQSIKQFIQEWPIETITTADISGTATAAPNAPGGAVTATTWPGSNFPGVSIESVPDPADEAGTELIYAASQAVFLQYYGAQDSGNNDTILFRAEIPYTGITVGAPIKIEFGFFDGPWPIGETAVADPRVGMIDGQKYNIQLAVNGFIVYQTVFTPDIGTSTDTTTTIFNDGTTSYTRVSQIFKGLNINSATANVVITISYARSKTQDQNLFTYVVLS